MTLSQKRKEAVERRWEIDFTRVLQSYHGSQYRLIPPKRLIEKLGWKPGDRLDFHIEEGVLVCKLSSGS